MFIIICTETLVDSSIVNYKIFQLWHVNVPRVASSQESETSEVRSVGKTHSPTIIRFWIRITLEGKCGSTIDPPKLGKNFFKKSQEMAKILSCVILKEIYHVQFKWLNHLPPEEN